jgi:hypothetical protein
MKKKNCSLLLYREGRLAVKRQVCDGYVKLWQKVLKKLRGGSIIIKLYKNLKARLPKATEITGGNWLYDNLDISGGITYTGNISNVFGYWLLNSVATANNKAKYVYCTGTVQNEIINNNNYGVRPVISITKDYIYK